MGRVTDGHLGPAPCPPYLATHSSPRASSVRPPCAAPLPQPASLPANLSQGCPLSGGDPPGSLPLQGYPSCLSYYNSILTIHTRGHPKPPSVRALPGLLKLSARPPPPACPQLPSWKAPWPLCLCKGCSFLLELLHHSPTNSFLLVSG